MPEAVPTVMALAGISAAAVKIVEAAVSESKARRIENPSLAARAVCVPHISCACKAAATHGHKTWMQDLSTRLEHNTKPAACAAGLSSSQQGVLRSSSSD